MTAPEPDPHHRPHSRACGIRAHEHGTACHTNCPTCGGKAAAVEPSRDLGPTGMVTVPREDWLSNQGTVVKGGGLLLRTWREVAAQQEEELARLRLFQSIVSDLDRNPNGRHEGDADVGDHTGVSQGNPKFTTGDVVGYQIGGRPILMPPRGKRHDPAEWLRAGR